MMRRGSAAVLALLTCALAACAGTSTSSIATTTASGAADRIPIFVMKPDGAGPFPAVVIAHDCSGLGDERARLSAADRRAGSLAAPSP